MAAATDSPAPESQFGKPPSNVIVPPREVQVIIEKAAGFINRNGPAFEERLAQKEAKNPKFSFLVNDDAYRAFYQWRLSEIKAGRGSDVAAGRQGGNDAATAVAQQMRQEDKGPTKPKDFRFSARMPQISAQDFEVIRLTALFCAKNGRAWQTQLAQKENNNFQFDFLRPQHSLFQFFMRLQEQYRDLLNPAGRDNDFPEDKRIADLNRIIEHKFQILDQAKERAEYAKWAARQRRAKEEEEEKERVAFQNIDWQDFVVVATIEFTEQDDEDDLPAPTSLSSLQSASLEQRGALTLAPSGRRLEEAFPTGDMEAEMGMGMAPPQPPPAQNGYGSPYGVPSAGSPAPGLPGRPPSVPQQNFASPSPLDHDRAAERNSAMSAQNQARAAVNAPMNIRKDYQGRTAQPRKQATSMCPNCRQMIPDDQLSEHLRIEMLDPRWREQRAKEVERNSTTNLSTVDMAQNLKRLASQRSDGFDGAAGDGLTEEERERRKRAAPGYGHSTNISDQLRHIQQKAQQQ